MRKGKVFFHPIENTGALTISWTSKPKGDAVEAEKGAGVGFFSESGELLAVLFDEVLADQDEQFLQFNRYRIEIVVHKGNVTYSVKDLRIGSRKKKVKRRLKKS